ncbi:ABC transporter permease [Martelella soudanensis]|uniref:ABC transporter permease n=1 Tax=unclassified Martelella TaxID=2629616 RepID=UPI0015DF4DB7|nr:MULTISPECIES: ABC transporter permease subunit [unclassified Martelella]
MTMTDSALIKAPRKTVIVTLAAIALITVAIVPPDYATSEHSLMPPGIGYLLGTNDLGQSVLAGLVRAAPMSIAISLAAGGGATGLAVCAAGLIALAGRRSGQGLLGLIDLLQIVPSVLILLLIASWYQPDFLGIVIVLIFTTWHDDVRVLRALMERENNRDSTRMARQMGASQVWCLRYHIVPGLRGPLKALYAQNCLQAGMRAAGLGFLGLTDPRLLTWGRMMNDGLDYLHGVAAFWLLLPPLGMMSIFFFGLFTMGGPPETGLLSDLQPEIADD